MASSGKFSVSGDKYLENYHVLFYIEDAVAQLLEHKEDNPKVNSIKFFSDYFISVRDGHHTLFREFSFISGTPHNRASFVRTFWNAFKHIGIKGDLLTVREYHCLVELLCADFPFDLIQKTARIVLMDDAMDCLISFSDFLYAFQAQFYYEEFMVKADEVYKTLKSCSPREAVVVPTTSDNKPGHAKSHSSDSITQSGDSVDSMQFYRGLVNICHSEKFSCPPTAMLKELLSAVPKVSFYGFLMTLAKSGDINKHIGKLPTKEDLLHIVEEETLTIPVETKKSETKSDELSQSETYKPSSPSSTENSKPPSAKQPKSQGQSEGQGQLAKQGQGHEKPISANDSKAVTTSESSKKIQAIKKSTHTIRRASTMTSSSDDEDNDDTDDDSSTN